MADLEYLPATIAAGTPLSPALGLGVKVALGIWMPAAWTAAALTFQMSPDGGVTFLEMVDKANAAITIATPTAGTFIAFDGTLLDNFGGVNLIKIRSGTAVTPVNQAAQAIINIAVRTVSL